jgi:hypothetical protein
VLYSEPGRTKVVPADNRVSPGISAVQSFMHFDDVLGEKPRFFVLNTCKQYIGEVESYRWVANPKTEDEFEDRPVKHNDHLNDSCRYALHTHFFSKRRGGSRLEAGSHEARGG